MGYVGTKNFVRRGCGARLRRRFSAQHSARASDSIATFHAASGSSEPRASGALARRRAPRAAGRSPDAAAAASAAALGAICAPPPAGAGADGASCAPLASATRGIGCPCGVRAGDRCASGTCLAGAAPSGEPRVSSALLNGGGPVRPDSAEPVSTASAHPAPALSAGPRAAGVRGRRRRKRSAPGEGATFAPHLTRGPGRVRARERRNWLLDRCQLREARLQPPRVDRLRGDLCSQHVQHLLQPARGKRKCGRERLRRRRPLQQHGATDKWRTRARRADLSSISCPPPARCTPPSNARTRASAGPSPQSPVARGSATARLAPRRPVGEPAGEGPGEAPGECKVVEWARESIARPSSARTVSPSLDGTRCNAPPADGARAAAAKPPSPPSLSLSSAPSSPGPSSLPPSPRSGATPSALLTTLHSSRMRGSLAANASGPRGTGVGLSGSAVSSCATDGTCSSKTALTRLAIVVTP